jgi:Tfp pilus assembly protein PilF
MSGWGSLRSIPLLFLIVLLFLVAGCAGKKNADSSMENKQVQARLDLAERHLIQGENRQAMQQLMQVQNQDPDIPRLNFDLGLAYTALEDIPEAVAAYKRAVKVRPGYAEAWNNLGQIYLSQGKLDLAEKALHKALDVVTYMTPEKSAYNLAQLWMERGNRDKALNFARKSIKENWRFSPGYVLAADLLQERGKDKEALSLLGQGAEADPNNMELLLKLAETLVRSGEDQKAKKWFRRIDQERPKSPQAEVARDYLEFLQ